MEPERDASPFLSIELPQFEGPLDLLLHLIQKHELDVLDIPIAFVTARYLEMIDLMRLLDLDIAAEYLLMAATLTHIKSRMLLPSPPPDESLNADPDAEQGEDPRAELVRRLLEYQKFRAAGEELAARGVAGRDVFPRGMEVTADATGEAPLATFPAIAMIEAFQKLLSRRKLSIAHEVTPERISIADRIQSLVDRLKDRRSMRFDELFESDGTVTELVVTFLALLEMTRLRMTRLYQSGSYEQLHVTLVLTDVGDAASVVRDDWR